MSRDPSRHVVALPTVALAGARGFGAVHLTNLQRIADRVRLIAIADPNGPPAEGFGADVPSFASLGQLFAAGLRPDIVIIATPTGSHFDLARTAMEHGSDVYLEKPPVATVADFERLLTIQSETGRAIQVGFQSMGSHALQAIADLGTPTSVATWATWVRDRAYWSRSAWAGRRTMDGRPIVDGVVTNPLAHAVATALRIAGARSRSDVASVEVELLRANDIEADDTSSVRVRLDGGVVVSAALTLCAKEQSSPVIEVRTPEADALFWYKDDVVRVGDAETEYGHADLFEELLDHRSTGAPLSSSLEDSGAFMAVLEAVRTAPEPVAIPPSAVTWVGEGDASHAVVADVEHWVERTARAGALLSELHVPWAGAPAHDVERPVRVGGLGAGSLEVGVCADGSTVTPTSSPRPFLHPLRTPHGIVVTDAHPADHDWHLGLSVALQHVNGTNFWGGRTYTREAGYRWLDDHGRIQPVTFEAAEDGFTQTAEWIGRDGDAVLHQKTRFRGRPCSEASGWLFTYDFTLTALAATVHLGSPGTHGRAGGGYGGLSWRLPPCDQVRVRTADAAGEEAVHGTRAPWLAWTAEFAGGTATIALAGADAATRTDPWFVRVSSYPGIGSSLAWLDEVVIEPGASTSRSFVGLVADGAIDDTDVARLLGEVADSATSPGDDSARAAPVSAV